MNVFTCFTHCLFCQEEFIIEKGFYHKYYQCPKNCSSIYYYCAKINVYFTLKEDKIKFNNSDWSLYYRKNREINWIKIAQWPENLDFSSLDKLEEQIKLLLAFQ